MAEFFKNFTKKVADVATNVKTKAKDTYDVTLLKIDLRKKEADLDLCFEKLGRAYYVSVQNGGNEEKLNVLLNEAKLISEEILELKNKIAVAQNKKICGHCASIIDKDASYCEGCGQKIVASTPSTTDESESYAETEAEVKLEDQE